MIAMRKIFSAASIGVLSLVLMGCVGDPYYGGNSGYGQSYDGYYGGSAVVYRSGPRYDSRRYRNDRYYRDNNYRRGEHHERPSRRPDYQNTRPDRRPDARPDSRPNRPPYVGPNNDDRNPNFIASDGFVPIKRGPR